MHSTAHHEAAHAVVQILLDLGCTGVELGKHGSGVTGFAEWGSGKDDPNDPVQALRQVAEDACWQRHAAASYAGAEASRRLGDPNYLDGVDEDYDDAQLQLRNITVDEASLEALETIARRRAALLVEYYWPEIEHVARALSEQKKLSGDAVGEIVSKSMAARGARIHSATW